jgi:hypothetical protein
MHLDVSVPASLYAFECIRPRFSRYSLKDCLGRGAGLSRVFPFVA